MESFQKGLPHSVSESPPQMSFTKTSRRPCSSFTLWKSASTSSSTPWSTWTQMPVPPSAVTSSAVSSMVSGRLPVAGRPRTLRPVQYTVAPPSPSILAMPRPAPRVAPATTATFPVRASCRTLHQAVRTKTGDRDSPGRRPVTVDQGNGGVPSPSFERHRPSSEGAAVTRCTGWCPRRSPAPAGAARSSGDGLGYCPSRLRRTPRPC